MTPGDELIEALSDHPRDELGREPADEVSDEVRELLIEPARRLSDRDVGLIADVLSEGAAPEQKAEFKRRYANDDLFYEWADLILRRLDSPEYMALMHPASKWLPDEQVWRGEAEDDSEADDVREEWN